MRPYLAAVMERRYRSNMLLRARTVVTMDGPVIDNGAVLTCQDRIAAVGTFADLKKISSAEVLDLGEQILLPGLINAHCHLDYTIMRGRIPRKESFTDWIRAINAEKEKLSADDYKNSIHAGITESANLGTTSLVSFEAFPRLAAEVSTALRIWWLAELIDVRAPESAGDLVSSAVQALNDNENWGLAPHSPFTGSDSLYQQCARIAAREGLLLSTHVAESGDEMAMFRDGSGPLHEFLRSLGRDIGDCGKQTPLARFLSLINDGPEGKSGLSRWILVHLNELSESDFQLLSQIEHRCHVAHCPRSHRYFGHSRFAFERLHRQLGFNICLGTDSLASNEDLSLFAEMKVFGDTYSAVSPREIIQMVTVNPARALKQEHQLGRIGNGAYADVIAIPGDGGRDVFETIVAHEGAVSWLMARGTELRS